MHYETDYKLEDFILNTKWEGVPEEVKSRMKGCLLDLTGALIVGSRSGQFDAGLKLAEQVFPAGDIPTVGTDKTFGVLGAAAAMGHASNAYDIDDGHNMTRAHPGTSVIGGVLAASMEKGLTLKEFLETLLVSYETTIRSGAAIMDYYQWAHSSGTFGAVGTAAGVGRIYGFTKEQLNNALSVAEFNAPIVPGIRSVEYPSMNKDGVPFGIMVGMLAVVETMCGFTGNKNLLEADDFKHYTDDLGEKWQVMDLYFKPYTCCRWAHPAIDAVVDVMKTNGLTAEDIEDITIETFLKATMLSKIVPADADEAQYNIAYPVAAAAVYGDFGLAQCHTDKVGDPKVVDMMSRLHFVCDEELDKKFPAQRICRAVIRTKDGRELRSAEYEPRGEAKENIQWPWLEEKFRRVTGPVFTKEGQDAVVSMILGPEDLDMRTYVDTINRKEYWKEI